MKFSLKLALSFILLLAAALTLNGTFVIRSNFLGSLDTVKRQYLLLHLDDKERIERRTAEHELDGQWLQLYPLKLACTELEGTQTGAKTFAVFIDSLLLYSSLPGTIPEREQWNLLEQGTGYTLIPAESGWYMLIVTPLVTSVRGASLVSAYDISAVFSARDAQLSDLFQMTVLTLAVAGLAAALLSMLLTRPLKKLKDASVAIASGNYKERTAVKAGDEIGALSESFDIMAETIEDKIRALNANIRSRDEFVAAFTHELKTPMTSMLGYAAHLRSGDMPREAREKAANYIFRETKRLEELSRKLMRLAGLWETGVRMGTVDLGRVFRSLARTLPESGGVVTEFTECGGWNVSGDGTLLEDMLRNLTVNAVRACGESGRVRIGASRENGGIRVSVEDDGCGIAPEEIGRIAEPFYMVDKSRAREDNGSGLGLALCAKIAELHHTALHFESEIGRGTTVSFLLAEQEEEGTE